MPYDRNSHKTRYTQLPIVIEPDTKYAVGDDGYVYSSKMKESVAKALIAQKKPRNEQGKFLPTNTTISGPVQDINGWYTKKPTEQELGAYVKPYMPRDDKGHFIKPEPGTYIPTPRDDKGHFIKPPEPDTTPPMPLDTAPIVTSIDILKPATTCPHIGWDIDDRDNVYCTECGHIFTEKEIEDRG